MQKESKIKFVAGGGKTQQVIEKSSKNSKSLIVTKIMTLSSEIRRKISKINNNVTVTHYHQLIWDTGKQIGMPLSLDNWNQYEDILIFENKRELIRKYSQIFIDIEENILKENWIKILKRYFLEEDGEIFTINELKKGKSFRLNSSITNLTNNLLNYEIESNNSSINSSKTFYIPTKKSKICKDITKQLKKISKKSDVTILASTLEDIQNIEENLKYQKHLTFITKEEERNCHGYWFKKNRTLNFNPNKKKLKMATIEAFKGLESTTIFFLITENTSEKDLYSAITRAKDSLYIFNTNSNYSDKLRLNIDEIVGTKNTFFDSKLYIVLLPHLKENILEKYFKDKYKEYRDITLDRDNEILNRFTDVYQKFFKKIFLSNESVNIYNYKKHKGKQQLAITHNDTNIVLIVEQSITKESNQKDNYLVCARLETKDKFILEKALTISSQLFIPTNEEIRNKEILNQSEANFDGQLLDISKLMEKIDELPPITPIEDTPEYKKWKIYLELLEKANIFDVDIKYEKDECTFNINSKYFKIDKKKFYNFSYIYEFHNEYRKKEFGDGELIDDTKNKISLKVDKNARREKRMRLGLTGDVAKIINLKNAFNDIKTNDLKFYIFGNQKLPSLNDWQSLNINFKNSDLNNKQKESIKKALISEKIFMIQGPPGTGKTSVISEIAYQETIKGNKVLISSESNDAIENALERLNEDIFYPILYQSKSREEKNSSTDLPIEKDIGNFYKQRILYNLKKEIQKNNHIFLDIQNKFFEELNDDTQCENELKETYIKKVNITGATLNYINSAIWKLNEVLDEEHRFDKFDVVIIDEVSKATPIELNLAILKAKKIILVGDQKQLPPMLDRDITLEEFANEIWNNSEEDKSKKEIKKELYEHKTVFEKLIENNPHASTQLTMQYRMHENIQKAINQFYDEDLECGLDNSTRINQHKLFNSKNLVWIDTFASKENRMGTSFENREEINQTKKILRKLDKEYENIDFTPTIGVISFYGIQVNRFLSDIKNNFKNIKVDFGTVDTFQGQERDFIIVSMVRSNDNKDIGFARSLNRINVAFSRAKQLLVILGSSNTFTKIKSNNNDDDIKKAKDVYKNIFDMSLKGAL